jgi:hypothetical protein
MRAVILLIVFFFGVNSNAQKTDCSRQTFEYQNFLEVDNYVDAFSPWEFVKINCPKQSESLYTDGVNIIQYKIDTAVTPEEKEKLVRDVLLLYNQYHKNFPETTQDFEVYKGLALLNNGIDAKEEQFQLFDAGFSKALDQVTSGYAIYTYFILLSEKNKKGDPSASNDKMIEQYASLKNHLKKLLVDNPAEKDSYIAADRALDALANPILNCENLTAYYQNSVKQNQENEIWLGAALNLLAENCATTPIFRSMAEKLYLLKVSAQSANYLALANLKNRNFDDAKKYYIESAALETNPNSKATKYYTLATGLFSGDKVKAKEYLLKSLEFNPKLGKAYLFLAQLYANSAMECGKTEFEKKSVFLLAAQTVKKAALADEMLKSNVEMYTKEYSNKAPSTKEISDAKMNGKTILIGCWINEKITFPSK